MNVPGTLYVVATPIGNLDDITIRALKILQTADLVAAEDTRETRKLLSHFQCPAANRLISFYRDNEKGRIERIMGALNRGENVAIVSSRGTPGISDPAYLLVRAAHQAGLPVVPIPGASSLAAALSASGVPTDRFCFVGFLPRRPSKRRRIIEELKTRDETAVIYESPHRFLKTMSELHSALGDRELTICRELTKKFEEIRLGGFADLIEHFSSRPVRGEFIIILRASSSKEKHDQIPGQEEGI